MTTVRNDGDMREHARACEERIAALRNRLRDDVTKLGERRMRANGRDCGWPRQRLAQGHKAAPLVSRQPSALADVGTLEIAKVRDRAAKGG